MLISFATVICDYESIVIDILDKVSKQKSLLSVKMNCLAIHLKPFVEVDFLRKLARGFCQHGTVRLWFKALNCFHVQ